MKFTQAVRRGLLLSILYVPLTLRALEAPNFPLALSTQKPVAVPTFECLGVYWSPDEGAADNICTILYRPSGTEKWSEGLPLSYDRRNREYRGSLVSLKPGTTYEIQLKLKKTEASVTFKSATWKEEFPISRTVTLSAGVSTTPLVIKDGGTPEGYVLYVGAGDGSTVLDMENRASSCVVISASHVILRSVTLKGAAHDAILIPGAVHDVVIEQCDISGWGEILADGWGRDMEAGIKAPGKDVERIIIQRNKIHHPRSNSNDWSQPRVRGIEKKPNPHPMGAQGIVFYDNKGNHVIRYNDIFSDEMHRFNDGIGGGANFSYHGFPGANSDVYGNYVANAADDALEIEGGNCNVRIWGNYLEYCYLGIASAVNSVGPLYIFRNVTGVTRRSSNWTPPQSTPAGVNIIEFDNRGGFSKLSDAQERPLDDGTMAIHGGGRRYFLHNTILQPPAPEAGEPTRGARTGIGRWAGVMLNTVSRNNIYHVCLVSPVNGKAMSWSVTDPGKSPTNDLDYDLCNGEISTAEGQEAHAMKGIPIYAPANGAASGRHGCYALAPESPGYAQAERLPNFNDQFSGKGPDVGAHQSGTRPMEFGVHAYEFLKP